MGECSVWAGDCTEVQEEAERGVGVEEEAERGVGVAVVVYVPGWCVSRDRMSVVLQDVNLRRLLDDMASGDLREQLKASGDPTMNECGL